MLDKLMQTLLRLHTSLRPRFERARAWWQSDRFDVIRHRVPSRLDRRQRLLVTATAFAGLIAGGLTASAATGDTPPPGGGPAAVAATDQAMVERQAAADRAARDARDAPPPPDSRAATPAASPKPEPSPTESRKETPKPAPPPAWAHPMPGAQTTSCFGARWGVLHAGVDLAAPQGTPIRAAGSGTVTNAGWVFGGYGISVVIDHRDGHFTHYAHASEAKVSVGDRVEPGDIIALEGSTGDSTGPHLHFEVHKGSLWNQVEPTRWMANRDVQIGGC